MHSTRLLFSNNPRGFTLLEIMVVLAIISLLAIIGIPFMRNAQVNSRDTSRLQYLDEKINKALTEYYHKTNDEPGVWANWSGPSAALGCDQIPSGAFDSDVAVCSATNSTSTFSKTNKIDVKTQNIYALKISVNCTEHSRGSILVFYVDNTNGKVILCNEAGNTSSLNYR